MGKGGLTMKRVALLSLSFLFAAPSFAADLDGPVYSERDIYIERPAPRVVERHYYVPSPTYEVYDDEELAYAYSYYPRRYHNVGPAYYGYYPRWRHFHRHIHHRHRW
jgi:hypothetical protein